MYQTAQIHSPTSRAGFEYAELDGIIQKQAEHIQWLITDAGAEGKTGLELSRITGLSDGRISARVRQLEIEGQVIRTAQKRNGGAVVVGRTFYEESMGKAATKTDYQGMYEHLKEEHTKQLLQLTELKKALESYSRGYSDGGSLARNILHNLFGTEGNTFI